MKIEQLNLQIKYEELINYFNQLNQDQNTSEIDILSEKIKNEIKNKLKKLTRKELSFIKRYIPIYCWIILSLDFLNLSEKFLKECRNKLNWKIICSSSIIFKQLLFWTKLKLCIHNLSNKNLKIIKLQLQLALNNNLITKNDIPSWFLENYEIK